MLLQFTSHEGIDADCRLAAAIRFKNLNKHNWILKPKLSNLNSKDKDTIKANIFACSLKQNDVKIRRQLYATIGYILKHDFPHEWRNLLDEIGNCFKSDHLPSIFGASNVLLQIFKKYEFYGRKKRDNPLENIIANTFPTLANTAKNMLVEYANTAKKTQNKTDNKMAVMMRIIKPIFRIFYVALKVSILIVIIIVIVFFLYFLW